MVACSKRSSPILLCIKTPFTLDGTNAVHGSESSETSAVVNRRAIDAGFPSTGSVECYYTAVMRTAAPVELAPVTSLSQLVGVALEGRGGRSICATTSDDATSSTRETAFNFLVTADWGGLPCWPWTTPGQLGVARSMGRIAAARGSQMALSLGDHFYFHGVRSPDDRRFERTFERVFSAPQLRSPGFFRVVAGNHDHEGNVSAQLEYAARPHSRWHYPALYYSWDETVRFGEID